MVTVAIATAIRNTSHISIFFSFFQYGHINHLFITLALLLFPVINPVILEQPLNLPPVAIRNVARVDARLFQQRSSFLFLFRQYRRPERLRNPPAHGDAGEPQERGIRRRPFRRRAPRRGVDGVGKRGKSDAHCG